MACILIDRKKSKAIVQHPNLASLPHVCLSAPPEKSKFWRYHSAGNGCISSIEGTDFGLSFYLSDASNSIAFVCCRSIALHAALLEIAECKQNNATGDKEQLTDKGSSGSSQAGSKDLNHVRRCWVINHINAS